MQKVKQLESAVKEKEVTIHNMKSDMSKMEQELKELKENTLSAEKKDKENLLQENVNFCVVFYTYVHSYV